MRDERLTKLLERAAPAGELDAERRAWAVVRSAYDEEDIRVPRAWPRRPLLALAFVAAVVAAALSPPGQAVTGWVREAIGLERVEGRKDARPALASLPAQGRLLVVSGGGVWVVRPDGSKRRLGAYSDAAWSPQGLHVALARGPRLVAATPAGVVRWSLSRPPRVVAPRWSPSGFRVAYGVGGTLRVVHGDGEPDRLVARGVRPGSWAWHPDPERNVLAYATRGGVVRVVDVDDERRLWQRNEGENRPEELAWSSDGRRLVARGANALSVLDARGRFLGAEATAGPSRDLAFGPAGHAFAVVSQTAGRSRVVLLQAERNGRPRLLFRGAGRLGDLAWSPDGRWLLVTWPSADQWLFLRTPAVRRIAAVSGIRQEFDPGARRERGPPPRLGGWCC